MYHNSAIDKLCMAFSGCSASFLLVQEALETLVGQFVIEISLYRHLCFADKLSDRFVKPVFHGQHVYNGDVNHSPRVHYTVNTGLTVYMFSVDHKPHYFFIEYHRLVNCTKYQN